MTPARSTRPSVAVLLDAFVRQSSPRRSVADRSRAIATRQHLEGVLDEHGSHVAGPAALAALDAEMLRSPKGAFARSMHAEHLYFALLCYLAPEYRMPGLCAARFQVRFVGELVDWLHRTSAVPPWVLSQCVVGHIEDELELARAQTGPPRQ
jgi:hypothetical protein